MAVALDLADEVLSVFSNSHRTEMTLIEVQKNLVTRMTTDEVLRIIRLPNLVNLFHLQPVSNDLCLIQLSPKLTLCEACLQKGCKNKLTCPKLHLCRHISHFSHKPREKPCQFPHQLSDDPHNRLLLQRFNYDTLNEQLLLNLLRLHYEQSSSGHPGHRLTNTPSKTPIHPLSKSRPSSSSQLKTSPLPIQNITDRQIDISLPTEREAKEVDLEIVQLLLATKNIIVERILEKQISTEFYRRFTLLLKTKQITDHILQNEPIIVYNNIPIKIKRTQRVKDTKIFALKFHTDQKIDQIRLNLYVETLVGKVSSNIFDMTPNGNEEQIYLIRCEQSIDFDHLYQVHAAKNTLQGYRVIVTEVYESETLEISFKHGTLHPSMTVSRLRQLIGETRWQQDVFACLSIRDQISADIELMNAEITAKWLSEVHRFERDLSLTIHPIIDFIPSPDKKEAEEDDEEITKLLPSSKISSPCSPFNQSDDSQKGENDPNTYRIKPDWRIVLTHPVFGDEYRKYIRENLNISAQITGSAISVPDDHTRKELARYTNMFMQKFLFREVSDLNKSQVKMIKENYSRMAHKWQKETNKTLLAARRDVMNELFPPPPTPANRQQNKILTTPTFRPKQSPSPRKQEQQPTPPPSILEESTLSTTTTEQILPYSIDNSVYFPFFTSTNSFADRLRTYLSNTFNIKLDIKSIASTKVLLELKGQYKDISDARSALTTLLTSLKTKTYSETNNSDQFVIPDIYRVVQWHLDQSSIVSSCSFSTKNGGTLSVRYFADNPQFGVDEQKLDDMILHHLLSISHQMLMTSKNLQINLEQLQNKIQQRSDYGQTICCFYHHKKEFPSIHLYGTKSIVRAISQEVKKIIDEFTPIPGNIQLQSNQVNYLLQICSDDLIEFEKQYENEGVDLRSKLKSEPNQFIAPKYLHEKIQLFLRRISQIQMISKDLKCSLQVIDKKKQELNNLALKHRCLMTITLASQPTRPSSSKITSGAINVSNGDLTTEQSDVLVVCSSSAVLRNIVMKAAGPQVEQELTGKDLAKNMIDTSAGQLKQAKRLIFLPWTPPATFFTHQDTNALRQSISAFVQQAMQYTIQGKFKSIAFPAIGCGGFGIPADIIATIMIDAVREQLTMHPSVQLFVTFVVQQPHIFDAFTAKLKPTSTASRTRSPSPPRLSSQDKVNITLTTSNANIDTAKKLLVICENMLNSSY